MPPASRPVRNRVRRPSLGRIRALDAVVVACVAALMLGLAMPRLGARWPSASGGLLGRPSAQTGEEAVLEALVEVANEKALEHVVLQLDVQPGFGVHVWPEWASPWGHVPELTLFDDGTVVYLEDAEAMSPIPYVVQLSTAEVQALVDQVIALGFDRLESQESWVGVDDRGESYGVTDGGFFRLQLRRDGELTSLRIYDHAPFVSEAQAFSSIVDLLLGWSAITATPLFHERAALFLEGPVDGSVPIFETALESAFEASGTPSDDVALTWPPLVAFPKRFPALVGRDALVALRASLPRIAASPAPGDFDAPDTPMAAYSSFWAWPIDVPDGHGGLARARIVVVPWVYGDRYPDAESDVEAYARALEAARATRRDAERAALTEVAADPPPTPMALATAEPWAIDPTPVWHPFPPDVRPVPLDASLGIQTWRHWLATPEDLAPLLGAAAPRFDWLKQRFAWADLEPFGPTDLRANDLMMHPDAWMNATRYGARHAPPRVLIQLDVPPEWARVTPGAPGIPPFDLNPWLRFVRAFAHRYAGQVDAYEILNEPNLAREWGAAPDPEAYAKVLAAAYRAIKLADPDAVVVSAGLAPTGTDLPKAMDDVAFLERLYAAMDANHGSDLHLDALGAHAPGYAAAPEVAPEDAAADPALGGARHFAFRRVEDLRAVMEAHGDADKQIVVTEFGWTTDRRPDSPYAWHAVSEVERAERLRAAFDYSRERWSPWIGPMIVFTAADPAWTADHEAWWWAVTGPDGGPTAALRDAFAAP